MSNTISSNVSSPNHDQQYQQPTSIRQQQYDANYANYNYANYQKCNNQQSSISNYYSNNDIISPDQQLNAASPNHNQHQQQYDNAISNYSENVTNSPDQQPNVSSPNQNQQYHQHSVASPNHQQQYDASYQQYIYQTAISNNTDSIIPGHNHHQQSSNNNNPDSNNTNHNNNQQSSSADIPPLSLNITINSPQTNFIIIPSSDMIQQVLACLNNPSSGFQR
ncbi:hypothetical protein RhiirA4_458256 [Rhizophagus irregularis]|uniref:Uncharacterized protein n=1 Tax=Rhizophagus irregularis TaxID=588596 RepID=A0A2I1GBT7_9GLOM|nr:hypothetical protein RhiirA4_458256 [Rhizophagus irregularis]